MAVYVGGTGSANQLDDYEEGNWTPVLQAYDYNNSNDWTNVSYDNNRDYTTGRYTKVGRICHFWYFTGAFSLDSGYNHLSARIDGLPFPFVNNDPYYGGIFQFTHATCFKDLSNNLTPIISGYGRYNSTYFYPNIGNSTSNARWGSENDRYFMVSGFYQTN